MFALTDLPLELFDLVIEDLVASDLRKSFTLRTVSRKFKFLERLAVVSHPRFARRFQRGDPGCDIQAQSHRFQVIAAE